MWEWLWWTGLITFSLIIIESLFVFDYVLVLATLIIGLAALVWIRFIRFPPLSPASIFARRSRSWRTGSEGT